MRNGEMGKCERVMNRQTESEIYGGIFTHGHKVKIQTIQLVFLSSLETE